MYEAHNTLCSCRALENMKTHLGNWQKSEFKIVKIHAMDHFSPSIKRAGLPWEYSSNMFEHMHIALMKRAYRSSNRRKANKQMVTYNRRLEALRVAENDVESVMEKQDVNKKTALHKVMLFNMNQ
jgi:hypothetical protein